MTKKELVLGSIITFYLVLFLVYIMVQLVTGGYLRSWTPPISSSNNLAIVPIVVLILMSVVSFAHGVLAAAGIAKGMSQTILHASIPLYFLFAFVPISSGFIILLLTGDVLLSAGLAFGGLFSSIIFSLLALRSATK